jgi:hypothetical protein
VGVWFDEHAADAQVGEGAPPPPTAVIEDGVIGKRLRCPMIWCACHRPGGHRAIAAIAYFATSTTTGLGTDLSEVSRRLPDPVVLILNVTPSEFSYACGGRCRSVGRRPQATLDALLPVPGRRDPVGGRLRWSSSARRWQIALSGSVNPQDVPFLPLGRSDRFGHRPPMARRRNLLTGTVVVSLWCR